jgi:ribosomal protein L4
MGLKSQKKAIKINRKEKRLAITTAMASAAINTIMVVVDLDPLKF